jgi:5-methylcytosine-specific restriction endonuclease McrA
LAGHQTSAQVVSIKTRNNRCPTSLTATSAGAATTHSSSDGAAKFSSSRYSHPIEHGGYLRLTKNGIHRLALYIEESVWSPETCRLLLSQSNDGELVQTRYALGLPYDIADFILRECRCAFCDREFTVDFNKCVCGLSSDGRYYLEAKFPTRLYASMLQKLLIRERGRVGNAARSLKIRENGGLFDRQLIPAMHEAQEGLCYYCIRPIELAGRNRLQADHYEPIAEGGKNDLANMVLACARCNALKNSKGGEVFDRLARNFRPPGSTEVLKRIRRRLKRFKAEMLAVSAAEGGERT